MRLSVILPVLNEQAGIVAALEPLQAMRSAGTEIIVVDGGSDDATVSRAAPLADRVIEAPRGRAQQMNAGVAASHGELLLFLHADTRLPRHADQLIRTALETHVWGRFDVRIAGSHPMLPLIAAMMNLRSRLTGIATGDQAMFMSREAFERAGSFPAIALMEDITLSSHLKRQGKPACLRARVSTSGRRWERHGVWRTIWLMWRLRAAYALGADPDDLAVRYGYRPLQVKPANN